MTVCETQAGCDVWAGHDVVANPLNSVFLLACFGSLVAYLYSAPPFKLKAEGWCFPCVARGLVAFGGANGDASLSRVSLCLAGAARLRSARVTSRCLGGAARPCSARSAAAPPVREPARTNVLFRAAHCATRETLRVFSSLQRISDLSLSSLPRRRARQAAS